MQRALSVSPSSERRRHSALISLSMLWQDWVQHSPTQQPRMSSRSKVDMRTPHSTNVMGCDQDAELLKVASLLFLVC